MALHIARLAEQAKQVAVAREQERIAEERVAELTRANKALSRTIDALARERSVDAFLATTMAAIAEALDSTSMTLWNYKDGFAHLYLVYESGRVVPAAESSHPNAHAPIFISKGLHTEADGALRRAPVILRVGDHPMWTLEQVEYLRARGVRALIEGVMVVEDRVVGTFTARLLEGQPDPPPARMSLVQALASQAALAIEMTRLADQARAGAVVEERNRLAREIHDTLAQGLAAIVQQLASTARRRLHPQLGMLMRHDFGR
jgi:nitrate/nitrite-specific signal transduction histidine kinase